MDIIDLQDCPATAPLLRAAGILSAAPIDQIAIDSRRISSRSSLFAALPGTRDGHEFLAHAAANGAAYALVREESAFCDPRLTLLRTPSPLKTLQAIAAYYRSTLKNTQFVAIAGSYGKTMLKDLLHAILKHGKRTAASPDSFNSQIGVPLSLFTVTKDDEIALIETAASQPGEMDSLRAMVRPDCGIITHFGKKHLHTMGQMETVVAETLRLFAEASPSSWLLVPEESFPDVSHPLPRLISWKAKDNTLPYAHMTSPGTDPSARFSIEFPEGASYSGIVPAEQHYYVDLLNLAVKSSRLLGAGREAIVETIASYIPQPTRTEIWQSPLGTTLINDIPCSDPIGIDNALRLLQNTSGNGRKIFIFTGLRHDDASSAEPLYKRVGQTLARSTLDTLYLAGSSPFTPLVNEMEAHSGKTEIIRCKDENDALERLRLHARRDDAVLVKGSKKVPFHQLAETFADTGCSNLCLINLAALEWNLNALKMRLPVGTRLMVMVKAHAYGSDSIRIARFLQSIGVGILGVSYIDEAVILRRSGIEMPIFVINVPPQEAGKVVKWNLEAGISSSACLQALSKEALLSGKKAKVHLHIDTGMSRFGCRHEEAAALAKEADALRGISIEGVMTHLACADDPSHDAFTLRQLEIFDSCIAAMQKEGIDPPWKHAANSACAIRFDLPQYNMVRIGLAAWGLHGSEAVRQRQELRLALSLISHIDGINICNQGDSVSYGRTYHVRRPKQSIAVLPIGYFDGLHRHYSGKSHVMVRGCPAPMVGSICMDYMMIDITDIPEARIGDPVLIFGTDQYGQFLPPEGLAQSGNSIAHELITCLGPRIPRVFIYEEAL